MHNDNKNFARLPNCACNKGEPNQSTVSISPCRQQALIAGLTNKDNNRTIQISATSASARHASTDQANINVSLRVAPLVLLLPNRNTTHQLTESTRNHVA
jgi:hypothetical protein